MQWVVEDCLCLDANRLAKENWFGDSETVGTVRWSNDSNISLSYRKPNLRLSYNLKGEPMRQTIHIEIAPCHFGGVRHYFTCPGCQSRRYKLHCASSGFYCRDCYRLPYYSQLCDPIDRATQKIHRLEKKLENLPKHVRTKTFDILVDQLESAERQWSGAVIQRFGALKWRPQ